MSRRRKPMAEINVVPYIDVTFVLLIIFMITAPLQQSNINVDLPVAAGLPVEAATILPTIITLDKAGKYYLSVASEPEIELAQEALLTKVVAAHNKNPEMQIYIRGDKAVAYGKVVSIMATLKKSGITHVGLLTIREQ